LCLPLFVRRFSYANSKTIMGVWSPTLGFSLPRDLRLFCECWVVGTLFRLSSTVSNFPLRLLYFFLASNLFFFSLTNVEGVICRRFRWFYLVFFSFPYGDWLVLAPLSPPPAPPLHTPNNCRILHSFYGPPFFPPAVVS